MEQSLFCRLCNVNTPFEHCKEEQKPEKRKNRRISFHDNLTTSTKVFPRVDPEMKVSLFYNEQDSVARCALFLLRCTTLVTALLFSTSKVAAMTSSTKSGALIRLHGLGGTPAGWSELESALPSFRVLLKDIRYILPPATPLITINGGIHAHVRVVWFVWLIGPCHWSRISSVVSRYDPVGPSESSQENKAKSGRPPVTSSWRVGVNNDQLMTGWCLNSYECYTDSLVLQYGRCNSFCVVLFRFC